MLRVLLALISHRFVLLAVALLAINQSLPSSPNRTSRLPEIHPPAELMGRFMNRVAEAPEATALKELMSAPASSVFQRSTQPFLWIARWVAGTGILSPLLTLLLLSNIFLFLFLSELNALFNRMVTPDVAASATILVVLWPTSYELSLGSSFTLTCFLATLAMRGALDNQWLVVGLGLALLALAEPLVLGLIPLCLFVFWYFQRHFKINQVIKRACFFFLPLGLAILWDSRIYSSVPALMANSTLFNLYHALAQEHSLGWTFSRNYVGQTVAILFFAVGAVTSFFSNTTVVHRLIPANMLLVLLLFSPYGTIASRAPLAAACLEGITSASSAAVMRLVQVMMFLLGLYEVVAVFR